MCAERTVLPNGWLNINMKFVSEHRKRNNRNISETFIYKMEKEKITWDYMASCMNSQTLHSAKNVTCMINNFK